MLRSFSGIFIGGIWGIATSSVLENVPLEARGFISGVLQQGYAAGYIIAAAINLSVVPEAKGGWRALFWLACGFSFATACFRALLPESEHFLQAEKDDRARRTRKREKISKEIKGTLKRDWLLCIYAVLLMGGKKSVSIPLFLYLNYFRLNLPFSRIPGRHSIRHSHPAALEVVNLYC